METLLIHSKLSRFRAALNYPLHPWSVFRSSLSVCWALDHFLHLFILLEFLSKERSWRCIVRKRWTSSGFEVWESQWEGNGCEVVWNLFLALALVGRLIGCLVIWTHHCSVKLVWGGKKSDRVKLEWVSKRYEYEYLFYKLYISLELPFWFTISSIASILP